MVLQSVVVNSGYIQKEGDSGVQVIISLHGGQLVSLLNVQTIQV